MPEMVAVAPEELSDSPAGKAPELIAQTYAAVPPVTVHAVE
jgi:hypothetical protein